MRPKTRHKLASHALLLSCTMLVACAPTEEESRRLVALYSADKNARDEKIEECKKSAGFVRKETDCLIAADALRQDSIGSFRNLPPLNLQVPDRHQQRSPDQGSERPSEH